jgi:hypothetical protein
MGPSTYQGLISESLDPVGDVTDLAVLLIQMSFDVSRILGPHMNLARTMTNLTACIL